MSGIAATPQLSSSTDAGPRGVLRRWAFATALAVLAGYVDAIGFLKLGGLFVSFMSGNSTRLAVEAAGGHDVLAKLAVGLIGAFLAGVVAGSFVASAAGRRRKAAVLALVSAALAAAAVLDATPSAVAVVPFVLAAAMGAANCVFQRDGEVSIPVTYMTGTLVKLGQHVATACLGRDRLGWMPYLVLWIGLVAGAAAGAAAEPHLGASGLWMAVGASVSLSSVALWLLPAEPSFADRSRDGHRRDGTLRDSATRPPPPGSPPGHR